MLNKIDLKIFVISLILVAVLSTVYVAIDGGFDKGHGFIEIKKLEAKFPVGSDYKLLEQNVLSLGYANYPCDDKSKPVAHKKICFKKRSCHEVGWDAHAISVSYDNEDKIISIDALGAVGVFDQTCAQADKLIEQQRQNLPR